MSQIAQKLADELATAAIEHIQKTGDEDIVTLITKTIGDSSQTLQEAFITSVRVQRAAIRAHERLAERAAELSGKPAPTKAAKKAPAKPAATPWDLEDSE